MQDYCYSRETHGNEHTLKQTWIIKDFRENASREGASILKIIRKLERASFPGNEALDITSEIALKPANKLFIAVTGDDLDHAVGYGFCVRWKRRLLLHKLCVSEMHRRQGVGNALLNAIVSHAKRSHCQAIDLWVDQSRHAAQRLYRASGFKEQQAVHDYYAPGRNGVRMALELSP